ncbi:MAG: SPOR domain-containing protein [Desulfobacterales bacterium]|nr:SPOR domain-containing protein [Desulfobacterales bacterium]
MEKKPSINRRVPLRSAPKPYMALSRWGAYGWLVSFIVLSGCMFVIGVVIGRNTAPVFDMDQIDAKMGRLKNSSLAQIEKGIEAAQKQKEHYLEVAKNIDIFEPLKEKGKNLLAYKQYIPPLKAPKFDKDEKPKEGLPAEEQPPPEQLPAEQTQTQQPEMEVAQAQPVGQPAQENITPISAEPGEAINEPIPQDKPLVIKEAAPKPKHIKEPAPPLLASVEPRTEKTNDSSEHIQPEEQPAKVSQEQTGIRDTANSDHQAAVNEQPPVVDEQASMVNMPQETPPAEAEGKPPAGSKQYTIQVASLREADKANIVKDKFREKGYPAYCQSSPVRGEVWHRVRIGPYPDRAIAEKDCRRLEEAGFDVLMFTVGN